MDVPSLRTFTSDFVIAETLNYLRARKAPSHIEERFFSVFLRSRHGLVTDLVHITSGRFATTVEVFRKHHDQGLSFTDCSTLVAMQDEDVRTLATFDRGFNGLVETMGLE